ncbi:MAG: DDE-type integrase/transposase/recombinase [Chitinophagaceae bacterium]|nr:DDE-type integrase/transposase/recombinase [Chitinophagaceae bacterium]
MQKKIAALEKQLQWEKLRADALDTLINVAEDKLNISIRKSLKPTVREIKKAYSSVSLQTICRLLGYTPQAYHKHMSKTMRLHLQEGLVLQQIQQIRKHQPRCGGRKLFIELLPFFDQHNIKMGRDAFFDLLRRNKLLVRKLKRNVYTTMSKHHFRRYPNLAKDFTPLKAHELWVADITYIPTKHRHAYLFLITDAYSRKIVGFHLSDDMKVSSGIMALKKHWHKAAGCHCDTP